jgi:hypothetical protein
MNDKGKKVVQALMENPELITEVAFNIADVIGMLVIHADMEHDVKQQKKYISLAARLADDRKRLLYLDGS